MKIVIFSGTTEGRRLSAELARLGVNVTVCVATEYGREEQGKKPGVTVLTGRLDALGMAGVLSEADLCVDATHPYAREATANIRAACAAKGVQYKRLLRESSPMPEGCVTVNDPCQAAEYLSATEGNVLLTTGAKELKSFSNLDNNRLYPRVLPSHESISVCEALGIPHGHIIAMQGPFTLEMNLALIHQFGIRWLITKDGGAPGGFSEKAEAARLGGAKLIVIRPPEDEGETFDEILDYCRGLL